MQGESVIVRSPRRKGAKSCMMEMIDGEFGYAVSGQPTKNRSNSNSERNSKFAGGAVIGVECPCTGPIVHPERTSSNKSMKSTQMYRKTFKVKAVCSQSALHLDIVPALFVAVRPT